MRVVDSLTIRRAWSMPTANTFTIRPIHELIIKHLQPGWIDPFANRFSPAEFTNDIDDKIPTTHHMDALEFVGLFDSVPGALLDPPYSLRQIREHYNGSKISHLTLIMNELAKIVKPGGTVITFGWNSNGFGKKRGFSVVEILLVHHGGHHNDTIATVEVKTCQQQTMF